MTRQTGITKGVVEFLNAHPGHDFSAESIALGANLPLQAVKNGMSWAVRQGYIASGSMKGMWRAKSDESPGEIGEHDILEVLRIRQDRDLVLIDAKGNLYVAKRINI